jgi:hypothetical protein
MIFRFAFHGTPYQLQEMRIIFAVPQRCLDINFLLRKKTAPEMPLSGQSQSIAYGTKMVAQGSDEPYLPFTPIQDESFCRTTKGVWFDGF